MVINCSHSALVKLADLRPNPANPNRHPPEQVALLAKNIASLGWRHPIIVSKRSGYVVAGHARLDAARLIGCESAPVDYQDFSSDAEERAYLLADNRIAELAERDNAAISTMLSALGGELSDMELTGYSAEAVAALSSCGVTEDGRGQDRAGASPWDRVGEAADGVMFSFGEVQCRLPAECYERFMAACPQSDISKWVEGVLNARSAC